MKLDKHEVARRFVGLPPEGQKTFLKALREKGIDFGQLPICQARNNDDTAVLSYAQARQWFLWQLEPQGTEYHINGALKLKGALNVEALKACFDALVARHESLRTVFRAGDDGLAVQVVQPECKAWVEEIDLSDVETERDEMVQVAASRLLQTPFDLTTGPLLRVGLIRAAVDEHLLVVVMHHIVSDGWSMQIIVNEFVAQYAARVQNKLPQLSTLPIQYADYAIWQRSWLEAGEQERQLAYWKNQLGDEHPVLQLQTDRPRRLDGRYRAAIHSLTLPDALQKNLQKRAHAEGA
ncbi:MAG TPA: condensation domain-containing protein, partial [Dongiaceae bacterium]|nr:condensation domain-containing protein [Dongiaceae bacterium]